MRFFTSDTHFGHANIIKYSNRPFKDVPHMNEMLIANWNAVVSDNDIIYHLGDVALGPWVEWDSILTRLNGYKVLVVGNHDRIFKGERERAQERFKDEYDKWFNHIEDNVTNFALGGKRFVNLSHFPYTGDSQSEARYEEFRLPDEGVTLIHGHTHAEYAEKGNDARVSYSKKGTLQIHVGMDAWDYKPVPEAEIVSLIKGEE